MKKRSKYLCLPLSDILRIVRTRSRQKRYVVSICVVEHPVPAAPHDDAAAATANFTPSSNSDCSVWIYWFGSISPTMSTATTTILEGSTPRHYASGVVCTVPLNQQTGLRNRGCQRSRTIAIAPIRAHIQQG